MQNHMLMKQEKKQYKHIDRLGLKGTVEEGKTIGTYKVNYDIIGNPKVSILIPNKDYIGTLKVCLKSLKKTTYKNYCFNRLSDKQTESLLENTLCR